MAHANSSLHCSGVKKPAREEGKRSSGSQCHRTVEDLCFGWPKDSDSAAVPQLSPSSCSWESDVSLFAQFLATVAFSEGEHKPAVTHRRKSRKVGPAGRHSQHRRHSLEGRGGFWRVLRFLHRSFLTGSVPITLALSQSSLVGLQGSSLKRLWM